MTTTTRRILRRLLTLSMATALLVCGCTSSSDRGAARPTIGLAVANQRADFFNMIRQSVEAAAEKAGFRVVVADAKGDGDTQVSQVQNFITQGVAAIIYIPAGATAATVPVRNAKAAGIPIVTVDRNPAGAPGDTFIATDSVAAARELGRYVIEVTKGRGALGVVQGQIGTTPELARSQGFDEALSTAPQLRVVAKQATQQWAQSEGFDIATDMLQAHPEITVLFGHADALALGAAAAARAQNRLDVKTIGFDGDVAGLQAVADGQLVATITQQTFRMGALAVESAKKLIAGTKLPAEQLQPGLLTTRDNAPTYLKSHP